MKQDCVFALWLLSLMFSAMRTADALRDSNAGIHIKYRTDCKLVNLRSLLLRLRSRLILSETASCSLMTALSLRWVGVWHCSVVSTDSQLPAGRIFRLAIGTTKTEVINQPAPGAQHDSQRSTTGSYGQVEVPRPAPCPEA